MAIDYSNSTVEGASRNSYWHILPNVAAASSTAVASTLVMPTTGTTVFTTGITSPVTPRNLVCVGNAAGISSVVTIVGTNTRGSIISETFTMNGTTPVVGNKAFATVTSIIVGVRNAVSDSVNVGTGVKLGLPTTLTVNSVDWVWLAGVRETTVPTVVFNSTNTENNTVTLSSTLNGTTVQIQFTK